MSESLRPSSSAAGMRCHILVVDDTATNRQILAVFLKKMGHTVDLAVDGADAVAKFAATAYDVVIMDVMMPVMDGLEATRRIRGDLKWNKLPIIMLTAKAMPDDQEKCLAAGASDYMAKPLDVDKLLSLVRVWMPR